MTRRVDFDFSDETDVRLTPPRPDRFGVAWPEIPDAELCLTCGQPDSCGDCNHQPLTAAEVADLKSKD